MLQQPQNLPIESAVPGSSGNVLEVRNLQFQYPGRGSSRGLLAVDGLEFELRDREVLSIVGPSGCGKSTLLSLLAGLRDPSAGRIHWNDSAFDDAHDHDVGRMTKRLKRPRRRHLTLVFQQDTVLPWRSVEDNVALGLRYLTMSAEERAERVSSLLKLAKLDEFRNAYPKELSGGMRRRVALLTGIAPLPHVVLLDEPFSALDEPTRVKLHEDMLEMIYRLGLTVVLVTHDVAEAITVSDRVLVLTRRPARVSRIIETHLGRQRNVRALRETPEYHRMYAEAWHELWRNSGDETGSP